MEPILFAFIRLHNIWTGKAKQKKAQLPCESIVELPTSEQQYRAVAPAVGLDPTTLAMQCSTELS